jgi:hypothetical protein
MGSTYIFLFSIFAILAIASILTLFYNLKRQKELTNSILSEKDQIKIAFDLCRKEKMDADDKLNLIQAQEKTYKVAYEDWKAKYEMLENRFILLKKELEAKPLPVAAQIFQNLNQQPTYLNLMFIMSPLKKMLRQRHLLFKNYN